MKLLFLLIFSLFFSKNVFAAACCGGGFAMPSTIISDDKAQFTSTILISEVKSDVRTDGLWRKRAEDEVSSTLRLEGAHLISDRWQVGAGVPIIQRKRLEEESSGLGDVNVSLGYEYLPELEYSVWKPRGVGFLQLTAPTGKSIYETSNIYGLDSRGRGFWALGLGTVLLKNYFNLDWVFTTEVHHAFQKSVNNEQIQGTLKPGWGNNTTVGIGYNTANFRFGMAASWSYEDPIDIEGAQSINALPQRFATASVMASYLARDDWAWTLSYADQTLLGSPLNTSLSKIISIQIQKRWSR